MKAELVTVVSAATTGVKNVYDITNQLISKRKRNKLITKGEMHCLEVKIAEAIGQAKQDARHALSLSAQDKLWESYSRIVERDPNSPFGLAAFELFREELQSYNSYNKSFDRLTDFGMLGC